MSTIPRAKKELLEEPKVKFLRTPAELPFGDYKQYSACELMEAVQAYMRRYGRKPELVYRFRTSKGIVWNIGVSDE